MSALTRRDDVAGPDQVAVDKGMSVTVAEEGDLSVYSRPLDCVSFPLSRDLRQCSYGLFGR